MPGKMSNRDRIAQKAAEAAATERQKTVDKDGKEAKEPKAPRSASKSAPKAAKSGSKSGGRTFGRIKIVWLVCGPSGAEVKSYPYAQEGAARTEAEQLTASSGKTHFVRRAEVPLST